MSTIIKFGVVLCVFALAGCASTELQPDAGQSLQDVSPKQAQEMIAARGESPDFVILDVRRPDEYAGGHLENAVNVDYMAADFEEKIKAMDRGKTYLVHCEAGKRCARALELMLKFDFEDLYNLEGGIVGWKAEGLPVVR